MELAFMGILRRMRNMKSTWQVIAGLFLTCSILFAQDDVATSTMVKIGDPMPAFTTTSLSGKSLSSDEMKGKVVLINFWATWCPPCKAELPLLQANIYNAIKDPNFAVVCISRGEEQDVVKKFIASNKYTFPVYLDSGTNTYKLFATKYIPRSFVVGKDGKVKWASTGFRKEEFDEMIKLIEAELKS
jgi:peroxiredoxin